MRKLISTGSPFEKTAGYSRAVAISTPDDHWCFVAGTTGYDYATMTIPESVADQTRNTMETISNALQEAGFSLEHVVRATYHITDAAYADEVFPIVGSYFSEVRPAATMVVSGLVKPEMKIEIEVTAYRA